MPTLRPYQSELVHEGIYPAWQEGHRNVLAVAPTGSGKTVIFSAIMAAFDGPSIAIAHRQELVSQISLALARNGVRHRILANPATRQSIARLHAAMVGSVYWDQRASVTVAGVDTLIRLPENDPEIANVRLWVGDEWHHCLRGNKWGKAVSRMPNAYGLGVTATPTRADGRGLGAHSDGVMHSLVVGPEMRDLIDDGYLTDYRIFCPPSDLDLHGVPVSADGDYNKQALGVAVGVSHIVGDVVDHYLRIAPGKLGVTFAVNVEEAFKLAAEYRRRGVGAEVVTADTPLETRIGILQLFREKRILQLVNVDLFGEGFDLPAIEVVSFARPTQSFSLLVQQFGRVLRLLYDYAGDISKLSRAQRLALIANSGKPCGIIIDHVGNVMRHGLPDRRREWTLDGSKRSDKKYDGIPMRVCNNPIVICNSPYERIYKACPFCGYAPVPPSRSEPEYVDGDLFELDPAKLAEMRGEVARIDGPPPVLQGLSDLAQAGARKQHRSRQMAQAGLRDAIALWAGYHKAQGRDDSEIYRRFFHGYGVDVMSAQALNVKDAENLSGRLAADLSRLGVICANN